MVFKDEFVVALLLVHTATDVDDAVLAGLVAHDAARGVVVGDHEVFDGAVGVVAERADPDALIVLSPACDKGTDTALAWQLGLCVACGHLKPDSKIISFKVCRE